MKPTTRRSFVKKTAIASASIPFLTPSVNVWGFNSSTESLSVHLFSKHLQFLDYKAVGQKTAEIGFAGVDLTVRPGGHVLPEFVKRDLPIAIEEIKKGGSTCIMMATGIISVENQVDVDVLKTASKVGIKYYRSNWYKYPKTGSIEEYLKKCQKNVTELSYLNKELNIVGCYQNHSGKYVGSSIWEVKEMLKLADKNYYGAQYDISHAVVDGGQNWEIGIRLIKENIKTIVLKDHKWQKVNGVWKDVDTPIGEGMVDFDKYFKLLKKYDINVPVSLHLEYPIGGVDYDKLPKAAQENLVYKALKKDLNTIQEFWREA